jgi:thiol:disulfide interchange protein DsbA
MNRLQGLLTIALIAAVSACGGDQDAAPNAETEAPTEVAAPATEAPSQSTTEQDSGLAQTEALALEVVEESTGDADDGDQQSEDEAVLAAIRANLEQTAPAAEPVAWRFEPGKHYTVLTTAQGTSSSPEFIEVAEVFWYGCPHCFNFDPYLAKWQADLPADVNFVRLPVMWNPTNQLHARVFYTAEALGKLDEMHEAIFREMHLNQKMLSTEEEILEFFARFGVAESDFQNTFRSFAVDSKLNRAKSLTQRYKIRSVPLLVVNGKFVTNGPDVKSFDDMIDVADELVDRERRRL